MTYIIKLFFLNVIFFSCFAEYRVVTSTNIIADLVKEIAGDKLQVENLMSVGVDPHLYRITSGDIRKLDAADLVIFNGAHLEGRLLDIQESLKKKNKIIFLSDGLSENELRKISGDVYDPHYWMNPVMWMKAGDYLSKVLVQRDPDNKNFYLNNFSKYKVKVDALDLELKTEFLKIPENQRIILTSHDAFSYFGNEYKLKVFGIQGISTSSEASISDIQKLIDLIVANKIKSIFAETSVSDRNIKAILEGTQASGHTVKLGGYLYADSLGDKDAKTYYEMIRYNSTLIIEGLK